MFKRVDPHAGPQCGYCIYKFKEVDAQYRFDDVILVTNCQAGVEHYSATQGCPRFKEAKWER